MNKQQVVKASMRLAAQRGVDPRNTVATQAKVYRGLHWLLDEVEFEATQLVEQTQPLPILLQMLD